MKIGILTDFTSGSGSQLRLSTVNGAIRAIVFQ